MSKMSPGFRLLELVLPPGSQPVLKMLPLDLPFRFKKEIQV